MEHHNHSHEYTLTGDVAYSTDQSRQHNFTTHQQMQIQEGEQLFHVIPSILMQVNHTNQMLLNPSQQCSDP